MNKQYWRIGFAAGFFVFLGIAMIGGNPTWSIICACLAVLSLAVAVWKKKEF